MNTSKREKFINILKYAEDMQAPVEFTDLVMGEINAIEQVEVDVNLALKSLLKQNSELPIPGDFTSQIMQEIVTFQRRSIGKPLIPKMAWTIVISTVCLAFVSIIYFSNPSGMVKYPTSDNFIHEFVSTLSSLPNFYYLILIATSILFFIDYMADRRLFRFIVTNI